MCQEEQDGESNCFKEQALHADCIGLNDEAKSGAARARRSQKGIAAHIKQLRLRMVKPAGGSTPLPPLASAHGRVAHHQTVDPKAPKKEAN